MRQNLRERDGCVRGIFQKRCCRRSEMVGNGTAVTCPGFCPERDARLSEVIVNTQA